MISRIVTIKMSNPRISIEGLVHVDEVKVNLFEGVSASPRRHARNLVMSLPVHIQDRVERSVRSHLCLERLLRRLFACALKSPFGYVLVEHARYPLTLSRHEEFEI